MHGGTKSRRWGLAKNLEAHQQNQSPPSGQCSRHHQLQSKARPRPTTVYRAKPGDSAASNSRSVLLRATKACRAPTFQTRVLSFESPCLALRIYTGRVRSILFQAIQAVAEVETAQAEDGKGETKPSIKELSTQRDRWVNRAPVLAVEIDVAFQVPNFARARCSPPINVAPPMTTTCVSTSTGEAGERPPSARFAGAGRRWRRCVTTFGFWGGRRRREGWGGRRRNWARGNAATSTFSCTRRGAAMRQGATQKRFSDLKNGGGGKLTESALAGEWENEDRGGSKGNIQRDIHQSLWASILPAILTLRSICFAAPQSLTFSFTFFTEQRSPPPPVHWLSTPSQPSPSLSTVRQPWLHSGSVRWRYWTRVSNPTAGVRVCSRVQGIQR